MLTLLFLAFEQNWVKGTPVMTPFHDRPFRKPCRSALVRWLGTFCLILLFVGCGKSHKNASARGAVTYREKPVISCRVIFYKDKGGTTSADLGPDGNYTIKILPGEYKVAIKESSLNLIPPDQGAKGPVHLVPERYNDPERSTLTASVKPGENTLDFPLRD
jgi:hypothetical protein